MRRRFFYEIIKKCGCPSHSDEFWEQDRVTEHMGKIVGLALVSGPRFPKYGLECLLFCCCCFLICLILYPAHIVWSLQAEVTEQQLSPFFCVAQTSVFASQ